MELAADAGTGFSRKGALLAPLRARVLSRDELRERAAEIASEHAPVSLRIAARHLRRRAQQNFRIIKEAYWTLAQALDGVEELPAGTQWLLDNYHVIEEQAREIRRAMPRQYLQALPKLTQAPWRGTPRVYRLAEDYLTYSDAVVEGERLIAYADAYQEQEVLSIGELWAVPIMLRLGLVENLRRLSEALLSELRLRDLVQSICQRTLERSDLSRTDLLLALTSACHGHDDIFDDGAALLLRRIQQKGPVASLAAQWFEERLRERGRGPEELLAHTRQIQAETQVSVGNAVTSLRSMATLDWHEWFESVSRVDRALRNDPAGLYLRSTFETRDVCRRRVEILSRQSHKEEIRIAEEVLTLAAAAPVGSIESHVGFYLLDQGRANLERSCGARCWSTRLQDMVYAAALPLYVGAISALTLTVILLCGAHLLHQEGSWFVILLAIVVLLFPVSEFATRLVQWVVTWLVPPRPLARLDFEEAIPADQRTLVVVHAVATNKEALCATIEALEIRYLGNKDAALYFGVLADLPDAAEQSMPGDRAIMDEGGKLIEQLNQRYSGRRFFILFRERRFNPSEGRWICWERKRGKLAEFNHWLRGTAQTSFSVIYADREELSRARFVITLDNDAQLPPGTAYKLVGTAAHPLNNPVFDEALRVVTRGYAIIQPRIGTVLRSALGTRFAGIFAGEYGLDPYTMLISDVYQDLFGEGSFNGKGIYHIDAFEHALAGRIGENRILSHDLFEGLFARVGLVTDVELLDAFPQRIHSLARRQHRWIRGDWQLLPFLGRQIPDAQGREVPSPLSYFERFKIADNLRRSLVDPALLLFFPLLWFVLPEAAWWWYGLLAVVLLFPAYNQLGALLRRPWWAAWSTFIWGIQREAVRQVLRTLLYFSCLPHTAWMALHAVGVTLYRLFRSKKNLLEWESALVTEQRASGALLSYLHAMRASLCLTLLLITCVFLFSSQSGCLQALPVLGLWLMAPFFGWFSGRAPKAGKIDQVEGADRVFLREVAFKTWSYFDSFLSPEYNYLIPDNFQVVPKEVVAERTSPTNISLSVLSVLAAGDLGFIAVPQVIERIRGVVNTLKKLERFQGHFLNWYQIRDLRVLSPRYVSAVDSGNLVGHFIAARQAFAHTPHASIVSPGFVEHVCALAANPSMVRQSVQTLGDLAAFVMEAEKMLPTIVDEKSRAGVAATLAALQPLLGWLDVVKSLRALAERGVLPARLVRVERVLRARAPTLSLVRKITGRILSRSDELLCNADRVGEKEALDIALDAVRTAFETSRTLLEQAALLVQDFDEIIAAVDFRFLFDENKKLMVIGYNLDSGRRDQNYYDLLASEARLASLVAIAKGDLPETHWFVLGRPMTDSEGGKMLLSWSGTMFEYLMPLLVCEDFSGTLLDETSKAVVRAQRRYASHQSIPWGISESAYAGVDFEKNYQYRAFGVPGLGLKRGLSEDLVIAPYASALALAVDPLAAIRNLRRLMREGAYGAYGFYDAVDYTPERLRGSAGKQIVQSFLAHHQGMTIVAIANCLERDIFRKRFHSSPTIAACELLLQERFPTEIALIKPHAAERAFLDTSAELVSRIESFSSPHTLVPRMRIISNGRYSALFDNAGSGYSFLANGTALTRWRRDALRNNQGVYIYVRDLDRKEFWSATYQPVRIEPDSYSVTFTPEKAEYVLGHRNVLVHTDVVIAPEENVEVRKVEAVNLLGHGRTFEFTSYGEVVLAPLSADRAHPAFSNLFVVSEHLPDVDALLFYRRPRSETDKALYLVHMLVTPVAYAPVQHETSRLEFIGRGRGLGRPLAMEGGILSGKTGSVLDPIFSLRCRVELRAAASQEIFFVTLSAETREEALQLAHKYHELSILRRVFASAWSHSDVQLRHEQFSLRQLHAFHRLAHAFLYNIERFRASGDILAKNSMGQSGLWRFGISGDDAILLVTISDSSQLGLVAEVLFAHQYLTRIGVGFEVVIFNEFPGGYLQPLQDEIANLVKGGPSRGCLDQRGGIFLRTAQQISESERVLLYSWARAVVHGGKGDLAAQTDLPTTAPRRRGEVPYPAIRANSDRLLPRKHNLTFFNGSGGFSADGKSYVLFVAEDKLPPRPWSNVIANEDFGFIVTEAGGGGTWALNSRENRLTPWSNDAVRDPLGEVLYVRDMLSGEFWSMTPRPRSLGALFRVEHGFGYTTFASGNEGISHELTVHGSSSERVKWSRVKLTNDTNQVRRLEILMYAEWVIGVEREVSSHHLRTGFDTESQVLWAQNPANAEFPQQFAFIGSSQPLHSYTASRREFLGRHGSLGHPAALINARAPSALASYLQGGRVRGVELLRHSGAGMDCAGVIAVEVTLDPGVSQEVLFFMAQAQNQQELRDSTPRFRSLRHARAMREEVGRTWEDRLGAVAVRSPDKSFDLMVNGWLMYQTYSSRVMGRTAFYQCSGAFGFRDQLQDSLAFLWGDAQRTRRQILLHAGRQYPEGDVQHWWHPPTGRGIRSRISDNYLWLPFAVLRYLDVTGDDSILDESVAFIDGPKLAENEFENYHQPTTSNSRATIFEHCVLCVERAAAAGKHGLPLIGSGDWNDGFNMLGREGRGESVWLAWFQAAIWQDFAKLCERRGDSAAAKRLRERAQVVVAAAEVSSWDGKWYVRAYNDSGAALGSKSCTECRIDSIAQSWAVICGQADKTRARQAMQSLYEELYRPKEKVTALLWPPFDKSHPSPGYIQGYPPGIRENGGQYTHAAAWAALAFSALGDGARAYEIWSCANPIRHTADQDAVQRYGNEPYVVSGDIYLGSGLEGCAGWSWYTGSSGWLYSIAVENILGLKVRNQSLVIDPVIPPQWDHLEVRYRHGETSYLITIVNPEHVSQGVQSLEVNGEVRNGNQIALEKGERGAKPVVVKVRLGKS